MNRRLRQLVTGFIAACGLAVAMPFWMLTALAGSAKISFSDPNAAMGEEFNVSVKIEATSGDLGAADVVLTYDPAYIEFVSGNNANGGAGSVRLIGTMDSDTTTVFSYNLKFKAVQAGNSTISVQSYEIYDKDTQTVEVSKVGSSAVKVAAPASYSSEARLASLTVYPGTLSPAFSPDVTSYTMNVGGDVNKIPIDAKAKDDGKAKVLVSGGSDLKVGANTITCKVIAEDGQTTKSYKITVNKSATSETTAASEAPADTQAVVDSGLTADIGGTPYTVAASFDPAALPAGFTQSTCTYNGSQIMSGSGHDITLIYLQDSVGTGGFYVYNETSGALSPYVLIDVSAKSIAVLPADETVTIPSGFAETNIELPGGHEVKGWVWESDEEQKYCVVYGMNENGEKGLYRYDIAERTIQRYFSDPAVKNTYDDAEVENLVKEYNSLQKDYNTGFIVMIALIILCLILFFMVINLLLKRREKPHPQDGRRQDGRRQEAPTPVKRRAMEQQEDVRRTRPTSERRGERGPDSSVRSRDAGLTISGRESELPARGRSVELPVSGRDARTSLRGGGREGISAMPGHETRSVARSRENIGVVRGRESDVPRSRESAYPPRSVETRRNGAPSGALNGYDARKNERRDYTVRHEESSGVSRQSRPMSQERIRPADDYEELRQRELAREERARQARERLERERRTDERRRYETRTGTGAKKVPPRRNDDFEFMDLN